MGQALAGLRCRIQQHQGNVHVHDHAFFAMEIGVFFDVRVQALGPRQMILPVSTIFARMIFLVP